MYIANLKPAIKHHLLLYPILHMFTDASEIALCIENNAELLGVDAALANAKSRWSQGNFSRSISLRKRETLPLQDDHDRNDDHYRQEPGGHCLKKKGKSRSRIVE